MTLGSSFGQTYFIALFSAQMRSDLNLTHGDYGAIYSAATLFSSITLIWLGRKIDDINLQTFSVIATFGLALAALLLATSKTIFVLGMALFLLRLTGQGLMWHAAATSMARYFQEYRGVALSISSAGLSLGEATLPYLTVFLLNLMNWREIWFLIAIVSGVVISSIILILLRNHGIRHQEFVRIEKEKNTNNKNFNLWSRSAVLKDLRFYKICLVTLAPAFIVTGLFFHQVHLIVSKGWSLSWFAICFTMFATCRFAASLLIGPIIDQRGAQTLLPWYLLPLIAGLIILSISDHPIAALFFMMLAGISTGSGGNISNALWAEIYGVVNLGSIRAVASAVMVFSSALSPAILGWLIDRNIVIDNISMAMAVYSISVSAMAYFMIASKVTPLRP